MTGQAADARTIIVTSGEPAGIGPDLCLALAERDWPCRLLVAADPRLMAARRAELGLKIDLETVEVAGPHVRGRLQILAHRAPAPVVAGRLDPANGHYVLDLLRSAVAGCRDGRYAAMVTAPVQKSTINEAGVPFSGHTEFLAELTGTPRPVMLLVAGKLRVALATTHLPLRAVPDALRLDDLVATLRVLAAGLRERFGLVRPRILVLGLNPHAGESGHLGREEIEVIAPAIARAAAEGIVARGPLPADTAFTPRQLTDADAVLAMYHDQGLPVLKYAGFGHAVNVTLGLPILRTSVDHGTALDLAGTGRADPGSLIAALELALGCVRA
ncbi:MAG TPA: 4-hydroxythreonine-4-phosphate dehydrogenase PdxA [Steroidobacteraceae bacterium]|nr:4-hydroxythreonine-4-phosphate dehydrogenase PdxA [Steroidobacteraceae bacterium]